MHKDIINLLKSSEPQDRIAGIHQLVDENHPDARRILAAFYKKETDETVKAAAKDAARRLQQATQAQPEKPKKSEPVRDPQAAKEYLEHAMTNVINLKNDEAWQWAAKAFQADPDLADDDYAAGLAAEITGMDRSVAVQELLAHIPVSEDEKPKRGGNPNEKEKGKNSDQERVSWSKALIPLGVYSGISALAVAIPMLLFSGAIGLLIASFDPSISASAISSSIGLIGIGAGVGVLVSTFLGLMLSYGIIHLSASKILGGEGYYTNLLYNVRWPLFAQLAVQVVMFGIMAFMLVQQLSIPMEVYETGAGQQQFQSFQNGINLVSSLNSLISLGFLFWVSRIVGQTYEFGTAKGCGSIVISGIIMSIAACGCYFVLIVSVLSAFSSASGSF